METSEKLLLHKDSLYIYYAWKIKKWAFSEVCMESSHELSRACHDFKDCYSSLFKEYKRTTVEVFGNCQI